MSRSLRTVVATTTSTLVALLALSSGGIPGVSADINSGYCMIISHYASSTYNPNPHGQCMVFLAAGQYLAAGTCPNLITAAAGSGSALISMYLPNGTLWTSNYAASGYSCESNPILADTGNVQAPVGGWYAITGECYSGGDCYAAVRYTVSDTATRPTVQPYYGPGSGGGSSSTGSGPIDPYPFCDTLACDQCVATPTCGWCQDQFNPGSASCISTMQYSASCPAPLSGVGYEYMCPGGSANPPHSTTWSYLYGFGFGNWFATTGYNYGWIVAAGLVGVCGVLMLVLGMQYCTRLCTDCKCCVDCCDGCCKGCAHDPTAEQRALPSRCDWSLGPVHWHTIAFPVLLPIALILTLTALGMDAYSANRDDSMDRYGAFLKYGHSDDGMRYGSSQAYATLCAGSPSASVLGRACPSLRTAGAIVFASNVLCALASLLAFVVFCFSRPYAASGRGCTAGGKPTITFYTARLVQVFCALMACGVVMWAAGGHVTIRWLLNAAGDSVTVKPAASFALMVTAAVLMLPAGIISAREILRQPRALELRNPAQGLFDPLLAALSPKSGQTGTAPHPAHSRQPSGSQLYYGEINGGSAHPAPVYGHASLVNTLSAQQNQPPPSTVVVVTQREPAYPQAPLYPVVVMPGAKSAAPLMSAPPTAPPPSTAASTTASSAAMPAFVPRFVLRVPVPIPAGLTLPPGAILFSNGDVCDADDNMLGFVPGMRA